jgi:hypothetical protein
MACPHATYRDFPLTCVRGEKARLRHRGGQLGTDADLVRERCDQAASPGVEIGLLRARPVVMAGCHHRPGALVLNCRAADVARWDARAGHSEVPIGETAVAHVESRLECRKVAALAASVGNLLSLSFGGG